MQTNTNNTKNHLFGNHAGISSILLIFTVLCLVSFATLSIVSANADYTLTSKVATRTENYYRACNNASTTLAKLDSELVQAYNNSSSETEYFDAVGKEITFTFYIENTQWLQVTVIPLYPEKSGEPFYKISAYQICNDTDSMEYNESLPVPTFNK